MTKRLAILIAATPLPAPTFAIPAQARTVQAARWPLAAGTSRIRAGSLVRLRSGWYSAGSAGPASGARLVRRAVIAMRRLGVIVAAGSAGDVTSATVQRHVHVNARAALS